MDKINIYIVNHTHWDREWYKTFDQFKIHLKFGVQRLINQLDNKEIENFFFDGQTIIVEDLKHILNDEYYTKFINYIKEGKIEIGPWYVLPDEGLIDNISYNQNLQIGDDICKNLGVNSSKVMYLPDTFGHDMSIPKLSQENNIDYAIIHRGLNSKKVDVTWEYENYKVKTIVLPTREGYYQTMFYKENYLEELDKYIKTYLENTNSKDVLILNGCDHTFVPDDFSNKINNFKSKNPNYNVMQVTLSEFFKKSNYEYNQTIKGEFRENSKAFLLPGVLSTRVYLKIQNRNLVDKLKYQYESITKILNVENKEVNNINSLWKQIVKNHPHDSICGCSIDQVHKEMEVRYQKALDNINTSIFEILNNKYYFNFKDNKFNHKIVILNHTKDEKKLIKFKIDIPVKSSENNKDYYLEDSNNNVYEIEVVEQNTKEKLYHDIKSEPDYQNVNELICFSNVNLKRENLNEFKIITKEKQEHKNVPKSEINKELIEKFIKTYINYKIITDGGDSYNFDPIGNYQTLDQEIISIDFKKNYVLAKIKSSKKLEIDFDDNVKKRTGEIKDFEVFTNITFNYNDLSLTTIKVNINNIHKNIKLVNLINIESDDVYTNTADGLIKRYELNNITYDAKEQNSEVDYNQKPTLTDIYIKDKNIQISHIGLNEMEVLNKKVYMTLFRSIGDLSKRNLNSRNGGAGPSFKTPMGQCIREMDFDILIKEKQQNYNSLNYLNLYPVIFHQYIERK